MDNKEYQHLYYLKTIQKRKEQYQKNKEYIKEYYNKNRENILQKQKIYYSNPDNYNRLLSMCKERYYNNPEIYYNRNKEYRRKNRFKMRMYERNYYHTVLKYKHINDNLKDCKTYITVKANPIIIFD